MSKLFIAFFLGIGGILIGAIMPKYYPLIEPYAGYILGIGVLFVVIALFLAGFECFKWCRNKKRIKEQIKPSPLNSPVIDPKNCFPQINLQSLKIWGIKWGKQYDHLMQVVLYDPQLGDPALQNQRYKYILYFEFEQNQRGELNETKFEEMQWETEAYPISECKDDIYKKDPSDIDLLYEWNITTKEPRGVNQDLFFVVFNREEVKSTP